MSWAGTWRKGKLAPRKLSIENGFQGRDWWFKNCFVFCFFFKILLIYLFINFYLFMIVTERERERGAETGRGRSRLHAPGARCGIQSRVSRIMPWAKGRRQTAAPPRDSLLIYLWENRERGRDTGRGKSRLHTGSPMQDLILDPGIMPWGKGSRSSAEPHRRPFLKYFVLMIVVWMVI